MSDDREARAARDSRQVNSPGPDVDLHECPNRLSVQQQAFLAHNLGNSWVALARDALCLTSAQVAQIQTKFPLDLVAQARQALDVWMQQEGSRATLSAVTAALDAVDRRDLAEEVAAIPSSANKRLLTQMSMPILRQLSSPEDDSPKCYHRKKSYKKRGQWRSRETYSINALDGVYSLQPLVWVLKQSWLVVVTFIFVGFDFGSRCYFCTAHGCDLESTWFCPFVINLLLRTVIAACGPIMLGKLSRAGLEVDLCFSKSFLVGPYRNHLLNERSIDISVRKPEDLVIQMKVNLERTARHFFGWSSVHALIMSAVCIMLSHYDPDHFLETSGSLVDALWSCFAILADVVVSSVALGSICAVMALYHCYRDVLTMILQLSGHPNTSTNKVLNQMNRIIKRFSVIAVIIVLGFSAEVAMAALVRKANHSKPQLYEEQSLDIVFCFVILTVALASCPLVLTKVLAVVLDVFILLKTTYYVQRVRKHSCLLNSVLEYHIIALGIAAALLLQEMTIQFSAIRQSQKRSKLCSIFHITLSLSILCCYILKSTLVS